MSLNLNTGFRKKLDAATKRLVDSLTDFEEDSENQERCKAFALSQFFHNSFMSVDCHNINRQMLGMADKFHIHAEHTKSEQVKLLYKRYLANDLSSVSFANSDVHYSMVSLLLTLSENPLETDYEAPRVETPPPVETDGIDWGTYLLEGIDRPPRWSYSSDEEDDELDDSMNQNVPPLSMGGITANQLRSSKCTMMVPAPMAVGEIHTAKKERADSDDMVPLYWRAKTRLPENYERCRLMKLCSLKSYHPADKEELMLKEYHVIRETIWLLSGREDLHVYKFVDGKCVVSDNVYLVHLSSAALSKNLQIVTDRATNLRHLHQFLDSQASRSSLTYQAFSATLRFYLNRFTARLHELEVKVVAMEDTFLLSDLLLYLREHLQTVDVVSGVYKNTIFQNTRDSTAAGRVSRLLRGLYDALVDENKVCGLEKQEDSAVNVILNMWLSSIKPYIDFIDHWITNGEMIDPHHEFALRRVKEFSPETDAEFWRDAIKLDVPDSSVGGGPAFPWLGPELSKIIAGGKSMEILKTLNIHSAEHRESISENLREFYRQNRAPVYGKWIKSLHDIDLVESRVWGDKEKMEDWNEFLRLDVANVGSNNLLASSFSSLTPRYEPLANHKPTLYRLGSYAVPLAMTLQRTLCPFIVAKSSDAGTRLLNIFQTQYGLTRSLDRFSNFQLMGWGDVMHHFATGVFKHLARGHSLHGSDLLSLNILMQDALAGKVFADKVFVNINANELRPLHVYQTSQQTVVDKKLIIGTDCIEIKHEVEWPLTLIITGESQSLYTRIFHYLMKIKHSIHGLESIHISTVYSTALEHPDDIIDDDKLPVREKLHRFAMLRFKMLHLLRNWQSFVMTSVILAEKRRFENEQKQVRSLDDLMRCHQTFLERIISLSLLNNTNTDKLVQGTLLKVMTLAVAFSRSWSRGVHIVDDDSLVKQENQFNEYRKLLEVVLRSAANRRSIPIIEFLAYSILS